MRNKKIYIILVLSFFTTGCFGVSTRLDNIDSSKNIANCVTMSSTITNIDYYFLLNSLNISNDVFLMLDFELGDFIAREVNIDTNTIIEDGLSVTIDTLISNDLIKSGRLIIDSNLDVVIDTNYPVEFVDGTIITSIINGVCSYE